MVKYYVVPCNLIGGNPNCRRGLCGIALVQVVVWLVSLRCGEMAVTIGAGLVPSECATSDYYKDFQGMPLTILANPNC